MINLLIQRPISDVKRRYLDILITPMFEALAQYVADESSNTIDYRFVTGCFSITNSVNNNAVKNQFLRLAVSELWKLWQGDDEHRFPVAAVFSSLRMNHLEVRDHQFHDCRHIGFPRLKATVWLEPFGSTSAFDGNTP